jgi:D-glycero-alpha-D-manno-heptose-7-phosphate kinase
MFIMRAPLRISLAGGGSDLIPFSREFGGQVASFAINKYVYLAFHETFLSGIRLAYSRTENVNDSSQIEHPLFKNAFHYFDFKESIEIGSFADVPSSGTGLGSSSAFTVALVAGLRKLTSQSLNKTTIAEIACHIEINMCGDPIGKQDQFASAFGGVNHFVFNKDGSTDVNPIKLGEEAVDAAASSLLLYFLDMGRSASKILKEQSSLMTIGSQQVESTEKLAKQVPIMIEALRDGDVYRIGKLLDESWALKRELTQSTTNSTIDGYYDLGLSLGALGGKVLGAGGGGFLLMCVPRNKQMAFKASFPLRQVPFQIDFKGVQEISLTN